MAFKSRHSIYTETRGQECIQMRVKASLCCTCRWWK